MTTPRCRSSRSPTPLTWLAGRLDDDDASVTGLTPPGTEPHDLAFDLQCRQAVGDAAVLLDLGSSYQPGASQRHRRVVRVPDGTARAAALRTGKGGQCCVGSISVRPAKSRR